MGDTSFSIGNNIKNSDFLNADVGAVKSSNSLWETIFGQTLPSLFQFGGATLAATRQARAQEEIARAQAQWYNPMTWLSTGGNPVNGQVRRGISPVILILLVLAVITVLFFVFRKK